MVYTKPPNKSASAMPPTPRSQGYRIVPSSPVKPDAIDNILGLCLTYVLPAFFFAGILVLGTMLISHTLVMRIPLPRQFTLIIVIVFACLITINFFLLAIFHVRRCRCRIPLQRVRYALSETSNVTTKNTYGSRSSSHSSQSSQEALLNAGAVAVPTSAQKFGAMPLRKVKCHDNIKQAAENQDGNKALVALEGTARVHDSTHPSLSSSSSSLKIRDIHDEQWPLRPSLPRRPSPLIIPSSSSGDASSIVTFVPEKPKEEVVYYLPPGPPSPLPPAGFKPMWANNIEKQMDANHEASATGKRMKWWFK